MAVVVRRPSAIYLVFYFLPVIVAHLQSQAGAQMSDFV
jgi:hypothetical protein